MEYIILGVCALMILLVSVFTEVRIIKKDNKIKNLSSHINELEQGQVKIMTKFGEHVLLTTEMERQYQKLSAYSDTLLKVLNKELGEEKAEELILNAIVIEQATDINQLFKDLVKDFTDDENSDYTDEESEEENNVR